MQSYWTDFFEKDLFLFTQGKSPQDILQLIFLKAPQTKTTTAIRNIGLYMLCRDKGGFKRFRQIIESRKPKTNWQVIKRHLEIFDDQMFNTPLPDFMNQIRNQLKKFKPFRISK